MPKTKRLQGRRVCKVSCTGGEVSVQIERPVEFKRVPDKRWYVQRYGKMSVLLMGLLVLIATPCGDGYIEVAAPDPMIVRFLNKKGMTPYAQQYYNAEFAQVFREQR